MNIGVIVARFQVPYLHEGHLALLNHVNKTNDHMIVFLGRPTGSPTDKNPLSFSQRKDMVHQLFPFACVVSLLDNPCDHTWSQILDDRIGAMKASAEDVVTLYGSRDSFLERYHGKHKTELLSDLPKTVSGTDLRKNCTYANAESKDDFRAGVIWVYEKRFPIVYPVVDMVVVEPKSQQVLVGQKKVDKDKYRFFGGFVDPTDASFEAAAIRELKEEANLDGKWIDEVICLGSTKINDWRYRGTKDSLISTLFQMNVYPEAINSVIAGDDIDTIRWISIEELKSRIADTHQVLLSMFLSHFATSKWGDVRYSEV